MMQKTCALIARHMAVLIVLVAAVAMIEPRAFDWISLGSINPMLGVVMFGMGLTIRAEDLAIVLARPKDIGLGCLAQFSIMPATAYALCKVLDLSDDLAIGVILVGCCPGGTASNVITYLAKGDLPLSVGMTAVSTLAAPVLTPLATMLLAGKAVEVDATAMFISIVQVVLLPIALGLLIRRQWEEAAERLAAYLPALSTVAIMLIVGIIVSNNAEKIMACGLTVAAAVVMHNLCGLLLGYLVGRLGGLEARKCTAISVEVGMQNSGLASGLAAAHFAAAPLATVPGAVFSVWHNISGAITAKIYAEYLNKEEGDGKEK